MRPKILDMDPANANLTGFLSNATGATWTLTATSSGDSLAHRVSIRNDSASDHSAKTAVLTGADADGRPQTETVSLPAGSATVESSKYFLTLLTVVPSATIGADTMDIGWVDEFVSYTIPLDNYGTAPGVSIDISTEAMSISVQTTSDPIQDVFYPDGHAKYNSLLGYSDQEDITWIVDDTLSGITADAHATLSDWPLTGMRFIVASYTDTAEVQATVV